MGDNVSVAQPASGTYGEKTDIQNLKNALPAGAVGNPAPVQTSPQPPMSTEPAMAPSALPTGRPAGGQPPPGVPSVLLAPTDQPHIPVNTPLQMPASPIASTPDPRQARMAVLDALANDPNVSPETREWAHIVSRALLKG